MLEARKELKKSLVDLIPTKADFIGNFKELKYSKTSIPTNVLSKYVVNKWECIVSDSDVFETESSIEHIMDENLEHQETVLIGNLLLLEQRINSSIPNGLSFADKNKYYLDSKYNSVKEFMEVDASTSEWSGDEIVKRCEVLGEELYNDLVKIVNEIA